MDSGLHLYYEIYGDEGTPLVLLHGGVITTRRRPGASAGTGVVPDDRCLAGCSP